MSRRKKSRGKTPLYKMDGQYARQEEFSWFNHYYRYLTSLSLQLFEWENLPDSVDPRFLEMTLQSRGYVGLYKDPKYSYIAVEGSISGDYDIYRRPTAFQAAMPRYHERFKLYNYSDLDKTKNTGVVIYNNDFKQSIFNSLYMFAEELAELKEIIKVNERAQKTPVVVYSNDKNKLSMQKAFEEIDGNSPVLYVDESFDKDNIGAINTAAPYVVDKLNTQRNAVWNEVMTFLGIKNANLEKKERMVTSEVDSNDAQIENSGNVFLKSRQEGIELFNQLYGTNVKVKLRNDTIEAFKSQIDEGVGQGGNNNDNATRVY